MSIINDALRKADRLKKWKDVSSPQTVESATDSTQQTSVSDNVAPDVVSDAKIPQVTETVANQPPFRITFSKVNSKSHVSHFSLIKILMIVFAACGFFVLLIGPWISIMLNRSVNEMQDIKRMTGTQTALHEAEPIKVIESTATPPPPAPEPKSFKRYSSPNVGVSVKPVPKTVQQQAPELVFKLTGISILNESNRIAFINGKVLSVGDKVGDAEVTEIQEKEVTLKRGNRFFTLNLE